jgi:NADH-quinone oxidoreductase subunit F
VTYHIIADLCTGCTDCVDACEDDAILGKKKFVHVIDQDECIQCGACMAACEEGAIVKAGAVKPKTPKKPVPCG